MSLSSSSGNWWRCKRVIPCFGGVDHLSKKKILLLALHSQVQLHMLKLPQVGPAEEEGCSFLWNVGSYLPNSIVPQTINHENFKLLIAMFATVWHCSLCWARLFQFTHSYIMPLRTSTFWCTPRSSSSLFYQVFYLKFCMHFPFLPCLFWPVHKADNLPPSCAVDTKSRNLNFEEPSGPLWACNGTALPIPCLFMLVI